MSTWPMSRLAPKPQNPFDFLPMCGEHRRSDRGKCFRKRSPSSHCTHTSTGYAPPSCRPADSQPSSQHPRQESPSHPQPTQATAWSSSTLPDRSLGVLNRDLGGGHLRRQQEQLPPQLRHPRTRRQRRRRPGRLGSGSDSAVWGAVAIGIAVHGPLAGRRAQWGWAGRQQSVAQGAAQYRDGGDGAVVQVRRDVGRGLPSNPRRVNY